MTPQIWQNTIDACPTGAWVTIVAAVPHLIRRGGGSTVPSLPTSVVKGQPLLALYEAAQKNTRVNSVHDTDVSTPLQEGLGGMDELIGLAPSPGRLFVNSLPSEHTEPSNISNAASFLASTRPNTSPVLR